MYKYLASSGFFIFGPYFDPLPSYFFLSSSGVFRSIGLADPVHHLLVVKAILDWLSTSGSSRISIVEYENIGSIIIVH
jgi:hypothetical protein